MDFACRSVRFSASRELMSGLGARSYGHADARTRKLNPAVGQNPAVLDQLIQRVIRHDDDVDGFTTLEPTRDGVCSNPHGRRGGHDVDLEIAFELRAEFKICRRERA